MSLTLSGLCLTGTGIVGGHWGPFQADAHGVASGSALKPNVEHMVEGLGLKKTLLY